MDEQYAHRAISIDGSFIQTNAKVTTADRIKSTIYLDILYKFDPSKYALEEVIGTFGLTKSQQENIVKSKASKAAREVCASYDTMKLASGLFHQQVEEKIMARLHRSLGPLPIELITKAPISLTSVSLPRAIAEEWEKAVKRQIAVFSLQDKSNEIIETLLRQELVENSESVKLRIKQDNFFMQQDPVPISPNRRNGVHSNGNLAQSPH